MSGNLPVCIAVTVSCASFVKKQDVQKHKKELVALVLNKILNNKQIVRSGIWPGGCSNSAT